MKDFARAISLAVESHEGALDKAGMPYILHPIRVAEAVTSEKAKIVAVLHDVVEDTDTTILDIYRAFDNEIGDAVLAMTKLEKMGDRHESYREYLDRVKANPLALEVKLADMADNSRQERLTRLSIKQQVRLFTKYTRGRHYLLTGEWYENEI